MTKTIELTDDQWKLIIKALWADDSEEAEELHTELLKLLRE